MEITVPVLAVCGLLYTTIAEDPYFSEKIRSEALDRAAAVAEIAVDGGKKDEVSKAELELSGIIKKAPGMAGALADYVGSECKAMTGGERM